MKARYPFQLASGIVMGSYTHDNVLDLIVKTKRGYEHYTSMVTRQQELIESLQDEIARLKSGGNV